VLLEFLLLVQNQKVHLPEQVGVSHPVELEVEDQGDPLDDSGSSLVGCHPAIEALISNVLLLGEVITIILEMISSQESYPLLGRMDVLVIWRDVIVCNVVLVDVALLTTIIIVRGC
jgi:hypothetical protein